MNPSPRPVVIGYREALPSDIPALARIRAETWGTEETWAIRIAGYLAREVNPQHALPPRVLLTAVEGENPVGLIAGHLTRRLQCDGELQWIDVTGSHRARGIASKLLRLLAEWFVEHDAVKVCVNVRPENTAARRLYSRHGAAELNNYWMIWDRIASVLGD